MTRGVGGSGPLPFPYPKHLRRTLTFLILSVVFLWEGAAPPHPTPSSPSEPLPALSASPAPAAASAPAIPPASVAQQVALLDGVASVPRGGAPAAGAGTVDYRGFVRVIDGDTIELLLSGQRVGIGLIGVKAPRGNSACGLTAMTQLQTMVRGGLKLEEDSGTTFDARQRRMYYGYARDGRSLALELVQAGVVAATGAGRDAGALAAAEAAARAAARGCLWDGKRVGHPESTFHAVGTAASGRAPDGTNRDLVPASATRPPQSGPTAPSWSAPVGFVHEPVAWGFGAPTTFAMLPDGRILVGEKWGSIRVWKDGAMLPEPFIDLFAEINAYWDRGLLDIALDPNFAVNGYVYILYTEENDFEDYTGTKTSKLVRMTMVGDVADPGSRVVILGTLGGPSCNLHPAGADCLASDAPSHSVGAVRFGSDGNLWVSAGDGSDFNLVNDNALRPQSLTSLAGKLLRVSPSGQGLPDNPFWTGNPNDAQSKIWAYGFRNPYRFGLHPQTGIPFVGDVGWNTWEELNVGVRGSNFGWPCYEGTFRQEGYEPTAVCQTLYAQPSGAVKQPLFAYNHNLRSSAITAGAFYTGASYPSDYQNAFFFGDFGQNWLRTFKVNSNNELTAPLGNFSASAEGPVDIKPGPNGDLYYVSINGGEIRRLRYTGATACPVGRFTAEFFSNGALTGTPALVQCDTAINYQWGQDFALMGFSPDNFSARWSGQFAFDAGSYRFSVRADDGARVWLDGQLILTGWTGQAGQELAVVKGVTAGNHTIKVEYHEGTGPAQISMTWQSTAPVSGPQATISSPTVTTQFRPGDQIAFAGSAAEEFGTAIPPERLAWNIIIHHCPGGDCHEHPLLNATGASGSFVTPDHGDDSHIEIRLTATGATGLTGQTSVLVQPRTIQLTLAASAPGIRVVYGGVSLATPITLTVHAGGVRSLSAPGTQGPWTFTGWSDGGAPQHDVTLGDSNMTLTASYAVTSLYAKTVLADSPAAYWRLNESGSGPIIDGTANTNAASYMNSATGGVAGAVPYEPDTAAGLDGVDDYLAAPASPSLRFGSAMTSEAWVYLNAYSGSYPRLVSRAGSYELTVYTFAGGEGRLEWKLYTANEIVAVATSDQLLLGRWYHVTATYDGATARIYINGAERASKAATGTLRDTGPVVTISRPERALAARVDEIAFYPVALPANRVQAHYRTGQPGAYAAAVLTDQPSVYWRLNETGGATAEDLTGNANTGTYGGNPAFSRSGPPGLEGDAALELDSATDTVAIGNRPAVMPTAALTVETWVNLTSYGGSYPRLISKANSYELTVFTFAGGEGRLEWKLFTANGVVAASTADRLLVGRWYHVAATYDGTMARIFINGVEKGSRPQTGPIQTTSTPFSVSRADRPVSAMVDEVAVYPTALSAARLLARIPAVSLSPYAAAVMSDGAAGYWRLSETTGTTAFDLTANGNHGVYTNGVTRNAPGALAGEPDAAASFDGVDDYVRIADSVSLSPTGGITVEAWVKLSAYSGSYPRLISKPSSYELVMYTMPGNQGRLEWKLHTPDDAHTTNTVTSVALQVGVWYHVAATYDGSAARVYINGQERGFRSVTGPLRDTSSVLSITRPDRAVAATLDDVAIYGAALAPARIAAHFAIGSSPP